MLCEREVVGQGWVEWRRKEERGELCEREQRVSEQGVRRENGEWRMAAGVSEGECGGGKYPGAWEAAARNL